MIFRIAIDAGGTFTDGVLMKDDGNAVISKAHTTPKDPTIGTMTCIGNLARELGLPLKDVLAETRTIVHGTTLALNVVATRSGGKMGTVATKGHRLRITFPHVAKGEWGEQKRDMYDFHYDAPRSLTNNYLMTEVDERINGRGEVLMPLDEEDVRRAVGYLKEQKVEAIAVTLMHSAVNPKHEQRIGEIISEEYPEAFVALSSTILPIVGEVERWSTTMFSAYVASSITGYVSRIREVLKAEGFQGELLFVQSNGGVATPDVVLRNPATLLRSGPAPGPSLGLALAQAHDTNNVLSVDMGGTSFDVAVVHDGVVDIVQQQLIDAKKFALPSVDVFAAGAGGGSIAFIDASGRLQVGPKSAGGFPGPACYGKGGEEPTVTDANMVLGYLDPEYFLGGETKLRKDLAEKAIKERVAEPLGLSVIEAAAAIYDIINARMAAATDLTFARRGYDPRDFTLCAAGGAAPVHAIRIMEELRIPRAIIPRVAPAYCAYGMLFSDLKHDYQRTYWAETAKVDLTKLQELYSEMEREAIATLKREGIAESEIAIEKSMEVRYYGQFRQRVAKVPAGPFTAESLEAVIDNFHAVHNSTVGYADPEYPTEIVRLHLSGIGMTAKPKIPRIARTKGDIDKSVKGTRNAYFGGYGVIRTNVYDGDKLRAGDTLRGPCIVEERFTTFILPPNAYGEIDSMGNYVATTKKAEV